MAVTWALSEAVPYLATTITALLLEHQQAVTRSAP